MIHPRGRFGLAALALALAAAGCDVGTVIGNPSLPCSATKTQDAKLELVAGDVISADVVMGAIRVRVDAAAPPSARAVITSRGRTDEEAKASLAKWTLVASKEGGVVRVHADGKPLEFDDGSTHCVIHPEVELEIVVPAGVTMRAKSQSGDIGASGALTGCDVATSFGAVALSGIRGDVKAVSQSGDVTIDDVAADKIEARTSFGAVVVRKAKAARVEASSKSGDVSLEDAGKGEFSLVTEFGAVRVRGGDGSLNARTTSGSVEIRDFSGRITARSGFGAVSVSGVIAEVDASTQSGAVEVDAAEGSTAQQPWTLRSSFGAVALRIPDAFACELDANTDMGDIEVTHPSIPRAERLGRSFHAVLGTGGSRVGLRTQSGGVRIERSSK